MENAEKRNADAASEQKSHTGEKQAAANGESTDGGAC